ncbi:MAG: hypothetical protein M3R37_01090 [Actinomycetota bacterium]|nr:hypothetical protein [Actinomycetota bacterium]
MGGLTAACARTWSGDPPRPWSLAALLAGAVGAACAGVVIAAQPDPWSLNWPLILVPAAVVPLPLLLPRRAVRVGAAVLMGIWCWLGSLSIGVFLVPCLLLMILAASREDA